MTRGWGWSMPSNTEPVMFRWETATYSKATSAQVCDVGRHRLHVSRVVKGSRRFKATLDGLRVGEAFDSMDEAKAAAEYAYRATFGEPT